MGEMKGKFANEEMYKRWKRRLIVIGSILLVVGVMLAVVGIINISKMVKTIADAESSQQSITNGSKNGFWGVFLTALGGFCSIGGIACLVNAFRREIASFGAATVAPVAKDVADYASEEIVPNVAKSIKDAKSDEETKVCSECGAKNKETSNFCGKCGKKI